MYRKRLVCLLLGAFLGTTSAGAQEQPSQTLDLTYERALWLARNKAPAGAVDRARVREAEAAAEAASAWRDNPELEGAAGPRFGSDGTSVDWSVGAMQWVELGGKRRARMASARAGSLAEQARTEDAQRRFIHRVSLAFLDAVYWQQRIALAREDNRVASSIAQVTTKRHAVGDVGGLEASLATLSVARSASGVERARAASTRSQGKLKALLGLSTTAELRCRGNLRVLSQLSATASAPAGERPDLRALTADVSQAQAEADAARTQQVPNVAIGAQYAREEADHIVQGTLTVTLPIFDHGQAEAAIAQARADRLRAELRAVQSTAPVEVHTAQRTAAQLSHAAHLFEEHGLESLERAARLATASYEAGAIPLSEVLTLRRELVQAKLDYLELLREVAGARITALTAAGGSP